MSIFTQKEQHTATTIGEIEYQFRDPTGAASDMSADISVTVLDENGNSFDTVNIGLIPHLTSEEKTNLIDMFTRLRALAEVELL